MSHPVGMFKNRLISFTSLISPLVLLLTEASEVVVGWGGGRAGTVAKREKRRIDLSIVIFKRAALLVLIVDGSASKAADGGTLTVRASLGPGMPWSDSDRWCWDALDGPTVGGNCACTGCRHKTGLGENWKPAAMHQL